MGWWVLCYSLFPFTKGSARSHKLEPKWLRSCARNLCKRAFLDAPPSRSERLPRSGAEQRLAAAAAAAMFFFFAFFFFCPFSFFVFLFFSFFFPVVPFPLSLFPFRSRARTL